MQNMVVFVVFLNSRCSFITMSAAMEYKKKNQVMAWNWVYRGSSHAVWKYNSCSVLKLVVLRFWGVVWVVFFVFLLSWCVFVNMTAGMEYNK